MWFCLACPLWGQVDKMKDLTPDDYKKWYSILNHQLSADGKWVSYMLQYEQRTDTLVVQSTLDSTTYFIPNGNRTNFSKKGDWFFAQDTNSRLWIIDLVGKKLKKINHIIDYQLSENGEYLAYSKRTEPKATNLVFQSLGGTHQRIFRHVMEYAFDPTSNYLAIAQKEEGRYSLSVIKNLESTLEKVILNNSNPYSNLLWSEEGNSLSFLEQIGETNTVHWMRNLDPSTLRTFDVGQKKLKVSSSIRNVLLFSEDGQKLFFKASELSESIDLRKEPSNNVQVWNTKDELLYPAYERLKTDLVNPALTICWNRDGSWYYVGDKENSLTMFGTDAEYAYSYSQKEQLLASVEREEQLSIYQYNTDTGTRKLVWQKPVGSEFQLSPSGRYLAYFMDGDWWVYDAKNSLYSNITYGMDVQFSDMEYDKAGIRPSYGHPGWTMDEKELILYDAYDLWTISPEGKNKKRITKGREDRIKYRIYDLLDYYYDSSTFSFQSTKIYNMENGLVLHGHGADEKTGYFRYSEAEGSRSIIYKDCFVSGLRMSRDRKSLVYIAERFDSPPKLVCSTLNGSSKTIFKTNPQHFNYNWGHSELVYFKEPTGRTLKGVLFYPANFDPKNKYPMITFYYETLSNRVHHYQNPSYFNSGGPNVSNFTTQGYFVFYPDIVFEIPDPGISAVNCILAGVNNMLKLPYIDKDRLGVFGHSFGGYETLFLITQTDMFATAVAAAGAGNMRSYYLSMAWLWNRPQSWRFEKQQWRMGDTYFNIPEAYERNSPINYVQNVITPLLSWAGKKDTNVNWEQHLEFFIAMRKLKKEHIMVLYENEGHSLMNPDNQIDMTNKLFDWYNYYLKGFSPAAWMTHTH